MVNSKSQVYLFIGDENYLKEKAMDDLSSRLLGSPSRELDYKVFYGDETDAKEILDYVATIPFSSNKKLVIIKRFEKLDKEDLSRLIAYIKKPSKYTHLVLDATASSILDDLRSVSRYIKVLRFDGLTDSQFLSWVRHLLASRDKKIEEDAIEILKELKGVNLLRVSQELDKLVAFVGERDTIKVSDVEEAIGKSPIGSIFDLARAISERKTDKALELVSHLISKSRKTYEIIGLLYWYFKRLLKAKVLQSEGETDPSIVNILGINRRYLNEFFDQLRSYDVIRIRSKMGTLLETDLDIKRTKFNPTLLLEFAIIRLCLT